jgi:AraC family transcriptional regulator
MIARPLFIPGSAGETFGQVLRTRTVGRFHFRDSRYGASLELPAHSHPNPYAAFVVEGDVIERSPAGERRYGAGSVHFHPPGDPHAGRIGARGARCLSIIVAGEVWRSRALRRPAWARASSGGRATRLARDCHREMRRIDSASDLVLEALAFELIATLVGDPLRRDRRAPRWLVDLRDHLHERFLDPIRLADLAAIADIHEVHLVRAFRRHFGATPGAYVRGLRIEHARRALAETDTPIAELALASGFSSQAHFTALFHRLAGTTPAAYRRAHARRAG